jgi:serine phosphatase RsbU (regulator of sigma subunit)
VEFEENALVTAVTRLPGLDALLLESVDIAAFVSPRDFVPLFVLVAAVILVAVGVLAFVVEHRVLLPLSGLTDSARRIAAGEYDLSIDSARRRDEIGTLSGAFEHMAAQVAAYTTRLEHMVDERTRELTEANHKLDDTNRRLTESIRYAQLIQDGVMAGDEILDRRLQAHALFLRERDIVGGDFLFVKDTPDGGFLLAVIDCEGHGVSGALMTMMADSFLRHITATHDPRDPAGILARTEQAVGGSLAGGVDEQSFTSGLDIGLCACFPAEGRLVFAGAGMPLYVRAADGTVATIAGRRKAIRSRHRKEPATFENHELAGPGRVFFMMTDGFVDQAGGPEGKAYGTRRLEKLLSQVDAHTLSGTPSFWQEEFDTYRGSQPQRDDVLAVGFTIEGLGNTMDDRGRDNG